VPPEHKLAKAELRDSNGILLVPLKGKNLDADLPQQILNKDLPREPMIGHNGGTPEGRLSFPPNLPVNPWEFSMQDIYRIEKEGNYTFTVCVAIYHFTDDKQSVVRMDLPSVSVHMYLTASPK
jgi:hypothetical protein